MISLKVASARAKLGPDRDHRRGDMTTHTDGIATTVRLDLGVLDAVQVQVMFRPYLSIMGLMKEVLTHTPRGLPPSLGRRIDEAVAADGHRSMRPLSDPRRTMAPSCMYPDEGMLPLADAVAALRDTPATDVTASIAENLHDDPPGGWEEPLRGPTRWMDALAQTVVDVARAVTPESQRAQVAIRREADRAHRAMADGAFDLFVNSLSPRLSLSGTVLSFDDPEPEDVALAGRRLVLVPMLAGPRLLTSGFDDPRFVKIGYPIPGFFQVRGRAPDSYLEELLGPTRAAMILCTVQPRTVGDLALMLSLSAATVSFHCDKLTAIGLVGRERVGQHVWVSCTTRGQELIELMGRPTP